jgi:hypothetical protein
MSYYEDEISDYLSSKLVCFGCHTWTDSVGNLYAVKGEGDTYPCIVAHMDEVHRPRPSDFGVIVHNNYIFGFSKSNNDFHGIGADDKNGIWVALKCAEMFDDIKICLFVGEEVGCVGSSQVDMLFFDDCRFVIQCDRRNGKDFINNIGGVDLCSADFLAACNLQSFGYYPEIGIMTDVLALKERGLDISCVNLSCGYYNAHTNYELTNFIELKNCLNFVVYIIKNLTDVYQHKYTDPYYAFLWDCPDAYNTLVNHFYSKIEKGEEVNIRKEFKNHQYEYAQLILCDFKDAYMDAKFIFKQNYINNGKRIGTNQKVSSERLHKVVGKGI